MNSKVRILLIAIFLLVGILAFIYVNLSKFIALEVKVQGIDCVSSQQLKNDLMAHKNALLTSDKKAIEDRLKDKYSCIKNLNILLKMPMVIQASVDGRVPRAQLRKIELRLDEATSSSSSSKLDHEFRESSDSAVYLADEDGYIFKKTEQTEGLVLIEVADPSLDVKQRIGDDTIQKISYLLDKIGKIDISPSQVRLVDEQLLLEGKPELKFTLKNDLDRQVASLQLILQKDRINSEIDSKNPKIIEMIDLRFDKPVVSYSSKK